MRTPIAIFLAASALGLVAIASCVGTGQNTMNIFKEQKGTVTLTVEVPEDQASIVTSVEFRVGDAAIAPPDTQAPWEAQWDTTKLRDGVYTVTAIGNPTGENIELLVSSVIVRNTGQTPVSGQPAAAAAGTQPAAAQFKR